MNKETILSRLDIRAFYNGLIPTGLKENGETQATGLCPFHDDHNPSLSVNLTNGLYNCFACDAKGDIFIFYEKLKNVAFKTALKDIAKMQGITDATIGQKVVATFKYKDTEGKTLYIKERIEPGKDGRSKEFRFKHREGDKWVSGRGCEPVFYSLPEVNKARYAVIVEGEAKADLLMSWGLVATCLDSGAKSPWRDEYLKAFTGKDKIIILPDNDPPGKSYALKIANTLYGKVGSIRIVELPGLKESEDILDWVRIEGNDMNKLLELAKISPGWEPEKPKPLIDSLLKWNDIFNLDVHIEYLLERVLPKNSITLIFGRGGIGKTSLCMQIARAIAEGMPWGELQTIKTPVYYIDFENPLPVLKERVGKIGRSENLYIWHISNQIQPPKLDSTQWELYKQLPPGLLIFDTFRASHLSDENDSKPMSLIMGRLKELREMGFTMLLLHHTPKGNDNTFKGSTAIIDLCDHVLGLEEVRDSAELNIEFDKNNLYKVGTRIKTRYEPHSIYLTFNPELKGFEIAKDPDFEKLQDIATLLKESQKTPNQTEFRKMIRDEFDYTDHEARRLIKKGEGVYWEKQHKGEGKEHKAFCYVVMSGLYIGHTTTQQNFLLDITRDKNSQQVKENGHLLLCQTPSYHNNITSKNDMSEKFVMSENLSQQNTDSESIIEVEGESC